MNRMCAPQPSEKLGRGEIKITIARPKLRDSPSCYTYPTLSLSVDVVQTRLVF